MYSVDSTVAVFETQLPMLKIKARFSLHDSLLIAVLYPDQRATVPKSPWPTASPIHVNVKHKQVAKAAMNVSMVQT